MGANLARNVAHHDIPVAVHNRTTERMDRFMQEHRGEERHLQPEESVPQVEVGRLLETAERARQSGRDPKQSRHAPQTVRLKEARESRRIVRGAAEIPETPSPREDRGKSDRERENMERRENRRGDHRSSIPGARSTWIRKSEKSSTVAASMLLSLVR
jgi:hypothetical protein